MRAPRLVLLLVVLAGGPSGCREDPRVRALRDHRPRAPHVQPDTTGGYYWCTPWPGCAALDAGPFLATATKQDR